MAQHLDLEEQEQLAELKHFWSQWGNLITWVLIAVFGAIAAWNGWQYWQRTQAAQASALYEEVERAAQAGDTTRVERAFNDLKDKFGRTAYAQQAGLMAASALAHKGNADAAKAALAWVAQQSSDQGYQAVARLRLASVLIEAKNLDEALQQLSAPFPREFEALAADRRGDIYRLQGKTNDAKAEYTKAYRGLEAGEYRRLVEFKLTALGVDVRQFEPGAASDSGATKS